MINDDGAVWSLPDFDVAMQALADPDNVDKIKLAKPLT